MNKEDDVWIDLEKISQSSPSATLIGKWVRELACLRVLISRNKLSSKNICAIFQTDGGHREQEVSLFSTYNHDYDRVDQIWSGYTNVGGKISAHVANGTKQRIKLFLNLSSNNWTGCVLILVKVHPKA